MIRKLLTKVHLYIGITAGVVLAFNGITGAMLAFRPQWLAHFGPEAQQVAPVAVSERLSPDALLQRALDASPGRIPIAVIIDADPTTPAECDS
jgi:sulfite reductase (NADPH) flavoprotein alpha-component